MTSLIAYGREYRSTFWNELGGLKITDKLLMFVPHIFFHAFSLHRDHGRIIKTVANVLSIARGGCVATLIFSVMAYHSGGLWLLATVGLFALTDSYDGAFARYFGVTGGKGGALDAGFDWLVIIVFHAIWIGEAFTTGRDYAPMVGALVSGIVLYRACLQYLIVKATNEYVKYAHTQPGNLSDAAKIRTIIECLVVIPTALYAVNNPDASSALIVTTISILSFGATVPFSHLAITFIKDLTKALPDYRKSVKELELEHCFDHAQKPDVTSSRLINT